MRIVVVIESVLLRIHQGRSRAPSADFNARCTDRAVQRILRAWDETNFLTAALRRLADGAAFVAASNVVTSPTYLPDLVHASLNLLIDNEHGIWHLANSGAVDHASFIQAAAKLAKLDASLVTGDRATSLRHVAKRPAYSALGSERGMLLPALDHALDRYCRECPLLRS